MRRINLKFNEIVQEDKIWIKFITATGPVDRKESYIENREWNVLNSNMCSACMTGFSSSQPLLIRRNKGKGGNVGGETPRA